MVHRFLKRVFKATSGLVLQYMLLSLMTAAATAYAAQQAGEAITAKFELVAAALRKVPL